MKAKIFEYEKPEFPADCQYNISPSMLHLFYDNPAEWYRSLGGTSSFRGNTSSVLGTICHHIYESVANGVHPDKGEINTQLLLHSEELKKDGIDLDTVSIIEHYPQVAEAVVNGYLLNAMQHNPNAPVELKMVSKIADGIYAGGTVDRIDGDCIVDFKTVGKKPNEMVIPMGYKLQLLTYAKIARLNGHTINRIRIVYGVRPQKTIGARCFTITETITSELEQLIGETLGLVVDCIRAAKEHPNLVHLIFREPPNVKADQ